MNFFDKKKSLNINGTLKQYDFPIVMGILNVTPDSFYQKSRVNSIDLALEKCDQMLHEGAEIIDIGAYSSRPGADDISENEEFTRLSEILKPLREQFPNAVLSVDTFRSGVADKCIQKFNIDIINDISGGNIDPEMIDVIAANKIPYILMHMKGSPQTMQNNTHYNDLKKSLFIYFAEKIQLFNERGVTDVIIDPGFGFSKTIDQNFEILDFLDDFRIFEEPLLVGLSRKSSIYKTLDSTPNNALNGTTVLNTMAIMKGADILRVHDVKEAVEVIKLAKKLKQIKKIC